MSPTCQSRSPMLINITYFLLVVWVANWQRITAMTKSGNCPIDVVYCGQVSLHQLQYLSRYELFSPIFGPVFLVQSGQTDRQTDRQKVMHSSPPCNLHRWAQKCLEGKLWSIPVCTERSQVPMSGARVWPGLETRAEVPNMSADTACLRPCTT